MNEVRLVNNSSATYSIAGSTGLVDYGWSYKRNYLLLSSEGGTVTAPMDYVDRINPQSNGDKE